MGKGKQENDFERNKQPIIECRESGKAYGIRIFLISFQTEFDK